MLKKAVSLVLVVVLLSVSSFNYVFATNENSSKMATKNDLEIMVNKTDNDNLTATIRNKSNGTQINYVYKKDIDGSSMLQYNIDNKYNVKVIIDKNNKVRTEMDKKTIDEFNNMIKNQSNVMLPSVISPNSVIGGGGGETQWNDGILEFVSGWNSEIGNIVPYAHPDYLYYKIGSKYNANLTGYTYNFTQIGTDTVSNINTVTGIALGGLIGGAIGATVGGTYGGLMGSIVGGALGGYFANKGCQALEDERGTVWSQIDKDPELVNKGTVYFPSYYAHFKVISVGPYYVDDYYFPMPQ